MFLPIGDEPNSHHLPVMTIALIVVNCAVFLLVTLPLSGRPVDPADPLLAQYLKALMPQLPPGTSVRDVLQEISAYDLAVYVAGSDPLLDQAIAAFPRLEAFLQQDMHERADYASSIARLAALVGNVA